MAVNKKLLMGLETTHALSEQFIASLSEPALQDQGIDIKKNLPLPLLSASAQALKSHVTKLSLLSINTPFTPSAIISVISDVNASALPSLVTAALLTQPNKYTQAYHAEVRAVVRSALRELITLIGDVKQIAQREDGAKGLKEEEKSVITIATGRVWKVCDQLVKLSVDGIIGVLIQKAKEYLDLVRDAIQELEEWDPEEDDFNDGGWDDDEPEKPDEEIDEEEDDDDEAEKKLISNLSDQKNDLLNLLTRISKFYTSLIDNRLKPLANSDLHCETISRLDTLIGHLRNIPDFTDEAAGSLYEHNVDTTAQYIGKIRESGVGAIQTVKLPWKINDSEDAEPDSETQKKLREKFSQWADIWLNVLRELEKSKPGP
ncbi:hypothetical protein FQN57_006605 [Myotisia sp. PD_48]|nr:hypothetical protein FQN57_006605 [Myotisia sp. PD_48]